MSKKNNKKNIEPMQPELHKEIDEAVSKCYACSKCISGCPMASEMDYSPGMMIKALALGQTDKIFKSKTIWVCSSCLNCYSRCPYEINMPRIIDLLKEYVTKNKLNNRERPTQLFHKIFLLNIKSLGRVYETGLIGVWKMFSGKWFSDLGLGAKMFVKGKLPMIPGKVKKQQEVKKLFNSE